MLLKIGVGAKSNLPLVPYFYRFLISFVYFYRTGLVPSFWLNQPI